MSREGPFSFFSHEKEMEHTLSWVLKLVLVSFCAVPHATAKSPQQNGCVSAMVGIK